MKTWILIVLFFILPGVIMGLVSSYRAGQKPHEPVFLVLKNFAQRIFSRAVRDHVLNYYMYYGLAIMFFIVALTG